VERLIRDLYASFNARDIEAIMPMLQPDVDWPNAWEGGRLQGRDAVRDYWTRQFAAIDGHVDPTEIVSTGDTVAVTVHQTVRDKDGNVTFDGEVTHTYTIRDGRIARMDVT
jgi:ketosteroid isomerase-like protein